MVAATPADGDKERKRALRKQSVEVKRLSRVGDYLDRVIGAIEMGLPRIDEEEYEDEDPGILPLGHPDILDLLPATVEARDAAVTALERLVAELRTEVDRKWVE